MKIKGLFRKFRKYGIGFFFGIVFALLCFVGLNTAMKPVSKSEYCGSTGHEMNTAYRTWELSAHGTNEYGFRVECVDCHLPPKEDYFSHMIAKMYEGGKDVYKHHFGGEYNVEKIRSKVLEHISPKRCLRCHDDLLARPSTSGARKAHTASLNAPDKVEYRCIKCHENAGHERQNKLFSP